MRSSVPRRISALSPTAPPLEFQQVESRLASVESQQEPPCTLAGTAGVPPALPRATLAPTFPTPLAGPPLAGPLLAGTAGAPPALPRAALAPTSPTPPPASWDRGRPARNSLKNARQPHSISDPRAGCKLPAVGCHRPAAFTGQPSALPAGYAFRARTNALKNFPSISAATASVSNP